MSHYLDLTPESPGLDLRDVRTRLCLCGSRWFRTIVTIGEDGEIEAYGLDGECVECGTRVKLLSPVDVDPDKPLGSDT